MLDNNFSSSSHTFTDYQYRVLNRIQRELTQQKISQKKLGEVCDVASSAYLPHSGKSRLGCEAGTVMKFVFIPFVYCWRAGSC